MELIEALRANIGISTEQGIAYGLFLGILSHIGRIWVSTRQGTAYGLFLGILSRIGRI